VTKANQMIDLKNGIILSDTPGILWPKFENELSGYRLAASGAVKDTAIEYTDVATFAIGFLINHYGKELQERYKLKTIPTTGDEGLQQIGTKRGCIRPGGVIDLHKAAELVLHELRAGKIGRITLETPVMVEQELTEIEAARLLLLAESADKPE
jgi:ribosome biogenesis GTPase A